MKKLLETLRYMKQTGQNPDGFEAGLAARFGVTLEDVQQAIADVGFGEKLHPEDTARMKMHQQRLDAKTDPQTWREYSHEEE